MEGDDSSDVNRKRNKSRVDILPRTPFEDLKELVYEPLADDVICLDMEEPSKERPSDDQVMMLIKDMTGATSSSVFQQLPDDIKRVTLKELKNKRASLRQLERLTGIGTGIIHWLLVVRQTCPNV